MTPKISCKSIFVGIKNSSFVRLLYFLKSQIQFWQIKWKVYPSPSSLQCHMFNFYKVKLFLVCNVKIWFKSNWNANHNHKYKNSNYRAYDKIVLLLLYKYLCKLGKILFIASGLYIPFCYILRSSAGLKLSYGAKNKV